VEVAYLLALGCILVPYAVHRKLPNGHLHETAGVTKIAPSVLNSKHCGVTLSLRCLILAFVGQNPHLSAAFLNLLVCEQTVDSFVVRQVAHDTVFAAGRGNRHAMLLSLLLSFAKLS